MLKKLVTGPHAVFFRGADFRKSSTDSLRRLLFASFACALSCVSGLAHSATETPAGGMTITRLGTQAPSWAYFQVPELNAEAAPRNCSWGLFYIDMTMPSGRAAYNTLVAAQLVGKKIARIDWSKVDGSSQCWVAIVQLQD